MSWTKEESESDHEEESAKQVTALAGICNSDGESDDVELTFEELAATYQELCLRSKEVCQQGEEQKKVIAQLQAEKEEQSSIISDLKEEVAQLQAEKEEHSSIISDLKEEVLLVNSKLDNMTKFVRMLNNGSTVLDEILQTEKNAENVRGLGYAYQTVKNRGENPEVKFVPPKKEQEKDMSNHMFQHHQRHQKRYNRDSNQKWRCAHCGRLGHLKPYCYKLYGYPKFVP